MNKLEQAAMQQALDALEEIHVGNMTPMAEENWNKAITALREALAEQAEQEPVAWMRRWSFNGEEPTKERKENGRMAFSRKFKLIPVTRHKCLDDDVPLYAAPVRTKYPCHPLQDLTDDEIDAIPFNVHQTNGDLIFARAVIAADREKNK